MKLTHAIYLVLAVIGFAAVLAIPLGLYGSGDALPLRRLAVSPGPLSNAHAFLEKECGACHTPNKDITAVACVSCHASSQPLLARQSTAFHAEIQECRFCHIEHQGRAMRPTRMDHAVLARIGWGKARDDGASSTAMSEIAHFLVRAGHPVKDVAALDCTSCHQNRDAHRGLFGRECAACHQTNSWQIAGFLHPSPRSQDCAQCHQPPPGHYMMHFHMLAMTAGQMHAKVEQCFLCHQTDSWNKGIGWSRRH